MQKKYNSRRLPNVGYLPLSTRTIPPWPSARFITIGMPSNNFSEYELNVIVATTTGITSAEIPIPTPRC